MSLFIASLAFEGQAAEPMVSDRLGILAGSLLSAVAGFLVLKFALPATSALEAGTGTMSGPAKAGSS